MSPTNSWLIPIDPISFTIPRCFGRVIRLSPFALKTSRYSFCATEFTENTDVTIHTITEALAKNLFSFIQKHLLIFHFSFKYNPAVLGPAFFSDQVIVARCHLSVAF